MERLLQNFEEAVMPHLGAGYNLARWLTRNDADAEDVIEEAYLHAFRHFGDFHHGDGRTWLLAIVRNTSYDWLQRHRVVERQVDLEGKTEMEIVNDFNPLPLLLTEVENELLRQAIEDLPAEFREVIVLRELEGLSYKQIADVVKTPAGTVTSLLGRARQHLQRRLICHRNDQTPEELVVGAF